MGHAGMDRCRYGPMPVWTEVGFEPWMASWRITVQAIAVDTEGQNQFRFEAGGRWQVACWRGRLLACGFSVSDFGSVIIFLLCASLCAASPALSRVVAPLSAALACTNWRRLGVRNCACRLFSGALPALGGELFTEHGHVVLLCLVLVLWFCCSCTIFF